VETERFQQLLSEVISRRKIGNFRRWNRKRLREKFSGKIFIKLKKRRVIMEKIKTCKTAKIPSGIDGAGCPLLPNQFRSLVSFPILLLFPSIFGILIYALTVTVSRIRRERMSFDFARPGDSRGVVIQMGSTVQISVLEKLKKRMSVRWIFEGNDEHQRNKIQKPIRRKKEPHGLIMLINNLFRAHSLHPSSSSPLRPGHNAFFVGICS